MNHNPWETEEGKEVWKTEAQYWGWLRGALRRLWSDYPLRKVWKKKSLRPLTREEKASGKFHPSTKNVGKCVFCGQVMAGSKLECDHIVESNGCTSKETAESFLWHCGGQTSDNFQLVCKPCHKIKSFSEAQGIPFEDAVLEKKAIQWEKDNKGVAKQRKLLLEYGIANADKLKANEIRQAYIAYLKEN